MSEYAWTYVKESKLPKKMREAICDRIESSIVGRQYMVRDYDSYSKRLREILSKHDDFDQALIEKHTSLKNYNKLRERANKDLKTVDRIRKGEVSFKDLSREEQGHAMVRIVKKNVYQRDAYVLIEGFECFRLDRCIEGKKFTTVDELLELLSKPEYNDFITYWEPSGNGDELVPCERGYTEDLKRIIRKHYSKFGDGNFFVEFG